jgi:hypothetical protein
MRKCTNISPYTATKIPLIYSFSGNSAASATISTFMCLWAIDIVPGSVYIFPPAEYADRSREYINHSQTYECGKWDWDPDIPFLGIFVSKFLHFAFAEWLHLQVLGSAKWRTGTNRQQQERPEEYRGEDQLEQTAIGWLMPITSSTRGCSANKLVNQPVAKRHSMPFISP